MSRIAIAVVGFGRFGRAHARCLLKHPDFELTCIVDSSAGAREDALALGIEVLPEVAAIPGCVTAATVATPADSHAAVAIEILEHGLDVLIEKPFATCESDINRILLSALRSDRLVCTGHIERFARGVNPDSLSGARPMFAEFHRQSRATGRGEAAVLDLIVHDLDLAAFLFNIAPAALITVSHARLGEMDVDVTVEIDSMSLRFYATYGAECSRADLRFGAFQPDGVVTQHEKRCPPCLVDLQGLDPLARQYSAFALALRGRASPIADARAGAVAARRALAILAAL